MCTVNSLARPLSYPRCSHNLLVIFSAFRSLVVGSYLKISHVPQENPQLSNLVEAGLHFTGEYSTISVSSDCIFIWNYWWTLHLLQCVSDGIWCYLWIIFLTKFQMFILNRWVNAMAFEDTEKHQSQEGWMACISYDALLLSLYQFSVMCFPLSDLSFPSIGKWWINATLQFVNIICSSSRHLASSKIANNLKSCHWYLLMNNHWYKATDFLICLFLP